MILGQKLSTPTGIQCALYPGKTLAVTQGIDGSYSHEGSLAIDDAGEDGGVDRRYAPVDLKCSWKDTAGGVNGVNWQTIKPVLCADGKMRHFTLRIVHDNVISDVSVGMIKKQGEVIGHEGVAGKATGNHSHIVIGDGLIAGQGLVKNQYGVYEMQKELRPWDVFFVDGTILKQTLGYPWKTYAQYVEDVKIQMKNVGLETKIVNPAIDETFISQTGMVVTVKKAEVVK